MNKIVPGSQVHDSPASFILPTAIRVETIEAGQWDRLLALFNDVSFDQNGTYATHRWGRDEVRCLVVREGRGDVIGGAVASLFRLPAIGGVAFIRFGPVWRLRAADESMERYERVVTAIRDHLAAEGWAVTIAPRPHISYSEKEAEALHRLNFTKARDLIAPRAIVNTAISEDEQLKSLAQTWRANLRKAEKEGLEIREIDIHDYAEFAALYEQMTERKQVTLYNPVEAVPLLRDNLPEDMRPRILMARHNGEAVAGIVYAVAGDTAYYMFGATSDKALPLRAGYPLQWAVLERLRGKVEWYDLGASTDSLRQFKSGLAGKAGATIQGPGTFDYAGTPRAYFALRIVFGLRDARSLLRKMLKALSQKTR
jgi:hypothetical protein